MKMLEIVVYTKEDYSENESIWVSADLSKKQITERVNKKFKVWHYYDIL